MHHHSPSTIYHLLFTIYLLTTSGNLSSRSPVQCRLGKTSTEAVSWRWRPDAVVTIYYIKNHFTPEETAAFSKAISKWNSALREINSQIVFIVGGESDSEVAQDTSITVVRGLPHGNERVGESRLYSMSNGVRSVRVTISPLVTDLNALVSLMTHELGHSLGLADCYKCKRGTTTMAAFRDDNKDNEVYEPSDCDKYVLASSYAASLAMR